MTDKVTVFLCAQKSLLKKREHWISEEEKSPPGKNKEPPEGAKAH